MSVALKLRDWCDDGTYNESRQPSAYCFGDYGRCSESRWSAEGKNNFKKSKGTFFLFGCKVP